MAQTSKSLTPNMQAVLDFIRKRYAETGEPVTKREMLLASPIPSRFQCTARVGLLDRGLILVPVVGTAAWVPA